MKKLVLILSLLPMLVLNLAPASLAATDILPSDMQEIPTSETNIYKKNKDRNMWSQYIEVLSETEAEEKMLAFLSYRSPYILRLHGLTVKDLFAIPNERHYLPDEPPIA